MEMGRRGFLSMTVAAATGLRIAPKVFYGKDPSWHPNQPVIAYAGVSGTNQGIHLLDVDTGETTQLSRLHAYAPSWHPRGEELAWMVDTGLPPVSNPYQIVLHDFEWGHQRQLAVRGSRGGLAWSPDGSQIMFSSIPGDYLTNMDPSRCCSDISPADLYICAVKNGRPQRLTRTKRDELDIWWSPKGPIAYTDGLTWDCGIWVKDRPGARGRKLTPDGYEECHVHWHPFGECMVFDSTPEGGTKNLCVMDYRGNDRKYLTEDAGCRDSNAQWHPRDNSLVFMSNRVVDWGIHILNLDGSIDDVIVEPDVMSRFPKWDSTGSMIAYVRSAMDEPDQIRVVTKDGQRLV